MTSFSGKVDEATYSKILNNYLQSKQLQEAYNVLEVMPPQILYYTRFLHACVQAREMEMAEKACDLMDARGIERNTTVYSLMIRGYGKKGYLEDALNEMQEMEDRGLEPTEDILLSLLDASTSCNDTENCMRIFRELHVNSFKINILRGRQLIRALCLQRNFDDAFEVFDVCVDNGVDGDLAVCSDLIDVSKECNLPERVPKVFKCMQRRNINLDIARSHTLISLLSQVDELKDALSVLDKLPLSAQRCDIGTYTQIVGSCFRAGLGDEAMRLIKEYMKYAPTDPTLEIHFCNYCMKGFRQLKSPAHCSELQGIMQSRDVGLTFETYKEAVCCCLEATMYKQALNTFNTMRAAGFEADEELANTYIVGLAPSKVLSMHNLAWDMYTKELNKGTDIPLETHEAVFDSCVSHARISRIVEVGSSIETILGPGWMTQPKSSKRHEHLIRAKKILNINAPNALSHKEKDKETALSRTRSSGAPSFASSGSNFEASFFSRVERSKNSTSKSTAPPGTESGRILGMRAKVVKENLANNANRVSGTDSGSSRRMLAEPVSPEVVKALEEVDPELSTTLETGDDEDSDDDDDFFVDTGAIRAGRISPQESVVQRNRTTPVGGPTLDRSGSGKWTMGSSGQPAAQRSSPPKSSPPKVRSPMSSPKSSPKNALKAPKSPGVLPKLQSSVDSKPQSSMDDFVPNLSTVPVSSSLSSTMIGASASMSAEERERRRASFGGKDAEKPDLRAGGRSMNMFERSGEQPFGQLASPKDSPILNTGSITPDAAGTISPDAVGKSAQISFSDESNSSPQEPSLILKRQPTNSNLKVRVLSESPSRLPVQSGLRVKFAD